jgi:hypothetical protein
MADEARKGIGIGCVAGQGQREGGQGLIRLLGSGVL